MISEISLNFQACIYIVDFSFKKPAKRTVMYLKSFWYKISVHEKLKSLDFLSDFVLISNDEIQLHRQ